MKYLLVSLLFVANIFATNISFEFDDINDNKINITLDKTGIKFTNSPNKIILLDFWGLYCPPCIMTIPHLIELQDTYKDKLEVIGIQVQDRLSTNQMKKFIQKFGINYKIVDSDKTNGFINIISNITNWQGSIPFMLLIDTNGKIRTLYKGLVSKRELSMDIRKIINN